MVLVQILWRSCPQYSITHVFKLALYTVYCRDFLEEYKLEKFLSNAQYYYAHVLSELTMGSFEFQRNI